MTTDLYSQIESIRKEVLDQSKILQNRKSELDRLSNEMNRKIDSILNLKGQHSRYNAIDNTIQIIFFEVENTPRQSELTEIKELLNAEDARFLNDGKNAVIELYYE